MRIETAKRPGSSIGAAPDQRASGGDLGVVRHTCPLTRQRGCLFDHDSVSPLKRQRTGSGRATSFRLPVPGDRLRALLELMQQAICAR